MRRAGPDLWVGRATPADSPTTHPGAAGSEPDIELRGGRINIRRTEGWIARLRSPHYRQWGPPAAAVSFAVGSCVGSVLDDGDVLVAFRFGSSDFGVMVQRRGRLIAALGAVSHPASGSEIVIQEDPRAMDAKWYRLAETLAESDTQLILLDASDPYDGVHAQRVYGASGRRLVIAIYGGTAERRRALNLRVSENRVRGHHDSVHYVDVDERFARPDDWLKHIRQLPANRPHDLWIRFTTTAGVTTLREERYAFVSPMHLFVLKVFRWGITARPSADHFCRGHLPAKSVAATRCSRWREPQVSRRARSQPPR